MRFHIATDPRIPRPDRYVDQTILIGVPIHHALSHLVMRSTLRPPSVRRHRLLKHGMQLVERRSLLRPLHQVLEPIAGIVGFEIGHRKHTPLLDPLLILLRYVFMLLLLLHLLPLHDRQHRIRLGYHTCKLVQWHIVAAIL